MFMKVLEKEDQTVVKIIETLKKKSGWSLLEKMEEWLDNWMEFREEDFYEEKDFFFTMKEIGIRKQELKVTDQELMTLWMLKMVKKRKRVEPFEQQILREVIKKEEGENMADKFEEKYKELKIEGKRGKT